MRFYRAALVLGLLAAVPSALNAQGPPPDGEWWMFRTEHFRVTFQPDLEPLAREAAAVAERTHEVLTGELGKAPTGTIDLVVTDHADYSNGFANPFPSNRIVVFARPATVDGEFFVRDWMELVVAHELVHIFELDRSGLVGREVRRVFGRVPFIWPVFSLVATPSWSTEGLAVYYETRLTGSGRIRATFHDMIIRTAALEAAIPELDQLSPPSPIWPAGNRAYVYGGRFMDYIAGTYGPDAHGAIIAATAGALFPTFLSIDAVAKAATGKPFGDLYDEWRAAAVDTAAAVARRVRAAGETATVPVAGSGPYAVAPRVSPDGSRLSFAASDWRSEPATRVVELGTGVVRNVARRNQFGGILSAASWLPDGSGFVVAQLEMQGPYRAFSDLWRVDRDGSETRLTRGLRLAQPDVAPDGRRVAAIQTHEGGLRLVVHDLDGGATRVVADAGPGEAFDGPRWSPDGRRIAVARHVGGQTDLVVVDPATGAMGAVTDDVAQDLAPAWSPDGRWLLWWSDRTGVPNILAVAVRAGRPAGSVRQVTNVVTGVIDPEVAPDGETLYVSVYHHDGWHIESLPFDPPGWREAPAPRVGYDAAILPAPWGRESARVGGEASPYSALATARPYYWLPTFESVGSGEGQRLGFAGVSLQGWDVLQRHTWTLSLAADVYTGRLQGSGQWLYRGMGNPQVYASASRDWSLLGHVLLPDSVTLEPVLSRKDEAEVGVVLLRRRWRTTTRLRLGLELERRRYEGRNLSDDSLAALGLQFVKPPVLAGATVTPGFQNVRRYPLSISPEDGVSGQVGVGRWWTTGSWDRGYDEGTARGAVYLAFPLWGFANHVLTVRGAGLVRAGPRAPSQSIGGAGAGALLSAGTDFGVDYPVRGFDSGARFGTRAWTASAEWRFPVHLVRRAESLLGFSLVSLSGALFADAGDAWCTPVDRARPGWASCYQDAAEPLVSTGAELNINFGVYHNSPGRLTLGVARPLQGGDRGVFYVGATF